ncbi:small guanosine triphosphatase family Ras family protein (macronuclear) [Tetrahymena thermophila SB210]|uniref:Small guanosine triphosphatase family Ras family protein n=2 Tax=Tetrahymena thermophila TaxID=5911 RepID=Q231D6_TETTS|nr:small guanosine triphosphatase family Ras family protein [Tetrahymena thermophila SB210]EAR91103.2 small guanosine triphosphatase family Ras family protein [Tetrahymena thermophila SB210]BAJ21327.1 Rab-family small GTPase RabX20 [Tetrahymena thermophila]|eukprot:XP_001011348.2 small guanosine triphosphatase family Ras family protein [Tetrahymena thermophila SB210]
MSHIQMNQNESNQKKNMKISIMICGNQAVGKTSIIGYYINGSFKNKYNVTPQCEYSIKNETIDQENVNVQMIDAPGMLNVIDITRQQIRSADGYIFVYDIYDHESFKNIDIWVQQIQQHKSEFEKCKCLLIGNKVDTRKNPSEGISYEKGQEKAKNFNMNFFETSAKEGTSIVSAIRGLAINIYHQKKDCILKQQNILQEQQKISGSSNDLNIDEKFLLNNSRNRQPKKNCWQKFKSCF